jgi:hypothetical protein
MATKKVKKFGRGGDILTGVGAALVGKALYDKYMGSQDDKKKDTSTKNEGSGETTPKPRIEEEVTKAQKSSNTSKNETFDKVEAKELSKRGKFPYETEDGTSGASPSEYKSAAPVPAPAPVIKKNKKVAASTTTSAGKSTTGQGSSTTTGVDAGIAAGQKQNLLNQIRNQTYEGQRRSTSGRGAGRSRYPASTETPEPPKKGAGRSRYTTTTSETRMKKGGAVKSASSRADGIAIRGKTRA